jgi:hypothetical protein
MRRWFELLPRAVSAVAIAVGSLALPAPALSVVPSGQETAVGVPPRVTMISDSTGAILFWSPTERERLAQGLDFQLQAMACRKLVSPGCYAYDQIAPSVLDTVESLGRDLGSIVIVDIGYNDEAEGYGAGLDSVMHALASAGVEHVIWLTLKESQETWAQINLQIHAAATRWPNLVVADWAAVAANEPSWFADSAHMNDVGAVGFVSFLRPIVIEACGAACLPPPPTATMLPPDIRAREVTLRWRGDAAASTYDLAVIKVGGAWRTVASRLRATSYRVRGIPGARMLARVRALDQSGNPGAWSQPRQFRFPTPASRVRR